MTESGSSSLIYDEAKKHFLGDFPDILPIEQAYVHIGMFLGWILDNDLYSEYFEEEEGLQIIRFKNREITCAILSAMWDGYLGGDMFNEEGNAFSQNYYQSGAYRKDYNESLAKNLPTMYHVEDTWANFDKISKQITKKFKAWKK